MTRWEKLTEIRVDKRQFSADANASDEPRRDQHAGVRGKCPEQGEAGVDREIEQKGAPAAQSIGHQAEHQRPEEHPEKTRREHKRQRHPIEVKPIDQDGAENAGAKNVKEIEEGADAGDRDDGTVQSRDRQPIEARGDRDALSGFYRTGRRRNIHNETARAESSTARTKA